MTNNGCLVSIICWQLTSQQKEAESHPTLNRACQSAFLSHKPLKHARHLIDKKRGVSENNGTPKSSLLIGFSLINHPFCGYPYFWKHPETFQPIRVFQKWSITMIITFITHLGSLQSYLVVVCHPFEKYAQGGESSPLRIDRWLVVWLVVKPIFEVYSLLGCPRKLGSMLRKWLITYFKWGILNL